MVAFLIAALLGASLAVSELVARYRDDPARAVLSGPAALYIGLNVVASTGALGLVHAFGWTFGTTGPSVAPVQVLVAGLGSAALFRSSLLNVTAGDQVLGIGPSAILNVVLTAADRAVDRERARIRSQRTAVAMRDVSFDQQAEALAMYCFAAMQNASPAEVKAINDKVVSLRDPQLSKVSDQVKSYVLGLALQSVVGDKVLTEAVKTVVRAARPSGGGSTGGTGAADGDRSAPEQEMMLTLSRMGEMGVRDLQERSAVGLREFSGLLEKMRAGGLVEVRGRPGEETVTLTGTR